VKKNIIVGARGSLLSAAQTREAIRLMRAGSRGRGFVFRRITTLGDRVKQWKRSDQGIFVKEIESALRGGSIDMAVHSVKDLPSRFPAGLCFGAVTKREEPRDILITRGRNPGLAGLKPSAIVGTTSLRRKAQVLRARPDLLVRDLRGNLDTRIKKLKSGLYDAIIVAAAGLKRLKIKGLNARIIPEELMLPAVGQGALGVEIRSGDAEAFGIARKIEHLNTRICVDCERAFLAATKAGCRMPVAGYARVRGRKISLEALIISLDGKRCVRLSGQGRIDRAEKVGAGLAARILNNGGRKILAEIKHGSD